MNKILTSIVVSVFAYVVAHGQNSNFDYIISQARERVQELSRNDTIVNLEPFIGDSLNNLNKELLIIMKASKRECRSLEYTNIRYRYFKAQLGKCRYDIIFRGPRIMEIYAQSDTCSNFNIRGLRIGQRVDVSKYEKVKRASFPAFTGYILCYGYRIPETEWFFDVGHDGKISFFWRLCSSSLLLIDEVMMKNQ